MEDAVPEDVKSERLARLQALLNQHQLDFNRGYVGEEVPVLLDRRGRGHSQLAGRSPWMQAVHVDFGNPADAQTAYGSVVDVRIVSAHPIRSQRCPSPRRTTSDRSRQPFDPGRHT